MLSRTQSVVIFSSVGGGRGYIDGELRDVSDSKLVYYDVVSSIHKLGRNGLFQEIAFYYFDLFPNLHS